MGGIRTSMERGTSMISGEECDCGLGTYPHPPHPDGLHALPPTLCKLEYRTSDGWHWVGAAAHALLYPRRYLDRLEANGKIGRVTLLDSGTVLLTKADAGLPVCSYCGSPHPEPYEGWCLL